MQFGAGNEFNPDPLFPLHVKQFDADPLQVKQLKLQIEQFCDKLSSNVESWQVQFGGDNAFFPDPLLPLQIKQFEGYPEQVKQLKLQIEQFHKLSSNVESWQVQLGAANAFYPCPLFPLQIKQFPASP